MVVLVHCLVILPSASFLPLSLLLLFFMTPSLPPSCVCLSLLPSISFIHSAHCFFHHPVGKSSPVFLHGFSCHGIIISTVLSRGKKVRDALCWFEDLLLNLSCNAYKYDSWTENPGLTFVVMLQLVTFSGFPSISDSKRSTSTIPAHTHTHSTQTRRLFRSFSPASCCMDP